MANDKMYFSLGDMYPGLANYFATEHLTNPDSEDQEALAETPDTAANVATGSRPKYIYIALLVVVLLVVFFGIN